MASPPAFAYTPITTPQTIRLLHLHPGAPSSPIQLTLTTVPLAAAPSYEALSYCWGAPTTPTTILCNALPLPISPALHTALAHFRPPPDAPPRTLWADAICIDQASATDKTAQVLLMPSIYSRAARTLVWLGDSPSPSPPSTVAASIRAALALVPSFDPDDAAELARKADGLLAGAVAAARAGQPNLVEHDWRPLARLLARPWFRRKWVVQEVALARAATLHAGGGVEVAWADVAALAFRMEALGVAQLAFERLADGEGEGEEGTAVAAVAKGLHCATIIHMVERYRRASTVLDGVVATCAFLCTDPRDHVYALLSLPAVAPDIRPDYESPVAEVYRRFAVSTLVEGRSLKVLGLAPDKLLWERPGAGRLEGLPSWAPDLRRLGEVDTLCSFTVRKQRFSAGGDGLPGLSLSEHGLVLKCRGLVVDSVKSVAASIIDLILEDMPEQLDAPELLQDPSAERREKRTARWLQSCHDIAFPEGQSPPTPEAMRPFARTMLCDMAGMRDVAPAELIDAFPGWSKFIIDKAAGKKPEIMQDLLQHTMAVEQSVMSMALGRRFCLTEGGRYGQLPLPAQVGDLLCVLLGGEVPYVLRPTGRGTYSFVGECYVDGIMYGEVLGTDRGGDEQFVTLDLE